jgi:hypothetical protein
MQTFSRTELARWLTATGLKSEYQFERGAADATPSEPLQGLWPWGKYHTTRLGHLEAAARRFWVNFDPSDNTTAPRNEEVIAWLLERAVSENIAKAIATILRPDNLPTGPRA